MRKNRAKNSLLARNNMSNHSLNFPPLFASQYQNADSIIQLWMLHGIASFYCEANNGGKFKE